MRPFGHLAVAFLPIISYVLLKEKRLPSMKLTAVAFVGSLFPDLIDKPLALQLDLIPTGRVFMHSLPFAIPVCVVVVGYTWRTNRLQVGAVFAFAYLSHLVADNYSVLAAGRFPRDLLWPFLSPVSRPDVPFWAGPESINVHLWTVFSAAVLLITTYYVTGDIVEHTAAIGPR
jgi:membrane-bound metal-dependent hydrolase YbcI (DUF457 family)